MKRTLLFLLFLLPFALCAQDSIVFTLGPNAVTVYKDGHARRLPSLTGNAGKYLTTNGSGLSWGTVSGSGTVTSVSVTTANGVSGSVATATTTPAISLTLGAITPTTVAPTGTVTLPANSTSLTPLVLTTGALNTNAVAGGIEYDGKAFYSATVANGRGVVPSVQFTSSTATFAFPNNASANPVFASTEDAFNLEAGTSYFFEGMYEITGMGATTRTTATLFGGTATLTSIRYFAMIQTGAANALGTTQSTKSCVAATAQVLNATATTAAEIIYVRGVVRCNGGGTFIPQVQHSADPTGTILVAVNSWFKIEPIGSNTVLKSGNIN